MTLMNRWQYWSHRCPWWNDAENKPVKWVHEPGEGKGQETGRCVWSVEINCSLLPKPFVSYCCFVDDNLELMEKLNQLNETLNQEKEIITELRGVYMQILTDLFTGWTVIDQYINTLLILVVRLSSRLQRVERCCNITTSSGLFTSSRLKMRICCSRIRCREGHWQFSYCFWEPEHL